MNIPFLKFFETSRKQMIDESEYSMELLETPIILEQNLPTKVVSFVPELSGALRLSTNIPTAYCSVKVYEGDEIFAEFPSSAVYKLKGLKAFCKYTIEITANQSEVSRRTLKNIRLYFGISYNAKSYITYNLEV